MLNANINHYEKAFNNAGNQEHRRGGRFPTSDVWSSLGDVIDLSFTGALILKRRFRRVPSGGNFMLKFKHEEFAITLEARVVRHAKRKGVGHLVAIEFVNATEDQHELIKEIVRNSRSWRVMDIDQTEAA